MPQRLSALLAAIIAALTSSAVSAQPVEASRYSLKALRPEGGKLYRDTLIEGGALPFDKRYEELTAPQRDMLKSQYERMAENDEPPYPSEGLAQIYRAVHAAQQKRLANGTLSVLVDIDSSGTPVSAAVYQTPDPDLGTFVAAVLLRQRFKPGVCGGSPCAMVYPFRVELRVR